MAKSGIEAEFEEMRALGFPGDAGTAAWPDATSEAAWKSNAHIHLPPNFSAFESVTQAVRLAAEQRVRVLGASNYYDFEIYAGFAAESRRSGVFPLFGLEIITLIEDLRRAGILINDPGNPGRMYICGKGIVRFAVMSRAALDLILEIRSSDTIRMRRMALLLGQIFKNHGLGIGLEEERIIESVVRRCGVHPDQVVLQERHIAQAFQESFFDLVVPGRRVEELSRVLGVASKATPEDAVKVQNEIRTHLMKVGKPAFVAENFLNFEQGYRLILELGGIPCYPTLADGANPICPYEDPPEKLVEVLRRNRIHCVEFIPIRNRPEVLERYVRTLRGAGFVITGGTEHNTPDLIPLEPMCVGGAPLPSGVEAAFREGACVVAAHQFLSLHGRCGYVSGRGDLNPEFETTEGRIEYFHRLGAGVIASYHDKHAQ